MGHALCLLQYLTSVVCQSRFYPYWKNNYFRWHTLIDRVNGPIDMRVWKERRFENILKLIAIINERNNFRIYSMEDSYQYFK